MIGKVWKVAKEVAIAVLLVLFFWWLLVGAYSKEAIGNVSDWISSLSTFLTLIVAYKAYKAAPNWLNQKLDETALTQATQIISRDLYQYRKLIEAPYNEVYNFVMLKDLADENEDVEPYLYEFMQNFKRLDNVIHQISEQKNKIEGDFVALHKMGWALEHNAYDKYKKLNESTSKLQSNYNGIFRLINIHDKFINDNNLIRADDTKNKIHKLCEKNYYLFDSFNECFQLFFHHSKHIPLYFEGKSK